MSCGLEFSAEFNTFPEYGHFNYIMMMFHAFDKSGTLPDSGGLANQSAQSMEILETLMELDGEHKEELRRRAEKAKK